VATYITKDANNNSIEFDFDGDGTSSTPFIGRSRQLLGATNEAAAASVSTAAGLNGLIRGVWSWLVSNVGATADAASSTGSIAAKLRFLITDTIGAAADAASATGSLMARIRAIAIAFESPNRFTRFGTSATDTISGTPARIVSVYVWNKSTSVRYFQLFNRASNPVSGTTAVDESFVLAPNEKFTLDTSDLGLGGITFSSGIAWGFSTTESTYTAGTSSEVSCLIRWRSA
jgi:hypothetical protein